MINGWYLLLFYTLHSLILLYPILPNCWHLKTQVRTEWPWCQTHHSKETMELSFQDSNMERALKHPGTMSCSKTMILMWTVCSSSVATTYSHVPLIYHVDASKLCHTSIFTSIPLLFHWHMPLRKDMSVLNWQISLLISVTGRCYC